MKVIHNIASVNGTTPLKPSERAVIYGLAVQYFEQIGIHERAYICKTLENIFLALHPEYELKYFRVSEMFPELTLHENQEAQAHYGWFGPYTQYFTTEVKEHQLTILLSCAFLAMEEVEKQRS